MTKTNSRVSRPAEFSQLARQRDRNSREPSGAKRDAEREKSGVSTFFARDAEKNSRSWPWSARLRASAVKRR